MNDKTRVKVAIDRKMRNKLKVEERIKNRKVTYVRNDSVKEKLQKLLKLVNTLFPGENDKIGRAS